MARSLGAQKNAARHRMTKHDYEMIVTYLENPDNFVAINGCGRKTKITWKTLTKVTAFGHMAVTLCAQGFVKCSGVIMGKKVARNVETYKKARTFYLRTGSVGDAGLPAEMVFDVRDFWQDSQAAFQFSAAHPMLSGDEEDAADREEEPIDLSEDDKVDNQTAPAADCDAFFETAMPDVTGGDGFYQTARSAEDSGPEMGNQTGRSASVDDVRSSGKTVRPRDRGAPPERRTSLITAYEEQVKEKLVLRKEAQDQKASFRDAILEDRRQVREQREREPIQEGIEAMRKARADRRSTLLAEMMKTGKSMDESKRLDNMDRVPARCLYVLLMYDEGIRVRLKYR
ncbi:hypothetical protein R1sor_019374 [Riccia sorocarpa]|uniref:Uncharacterized protein n=1 Tax=Riccia sorocarpa TaxID=122646 RepID=A0ABD3IGL3_9MARC